MNANFKKGIEDLGIIDANEIFDIINSSEISRTYMAQLADEEKRRQEFINRFVIPRGLKKKEYEALKKETQKRIDELQQRERDGGSMLITLEREDYIAKKLKLKKILDFYKSPKGKEVLDIEKAKSFPIEQLLEFKGGFTKCPFHEDKNPSAKYYKKTNRIHCFVCNQGHDAIDIYQKINNVNFNEAVKRLTN